MVKEARNPRDLTAAEGEARAKKLIPDLLKYDRVILLGAQVAEAFSLGYLPNYKWATLIGDAGTRVARMPHTSQTNWNTRGEDYWRPARDFARTLLG